MTKHTPGPWAFEPGDGGDSSVDVGAQPPTVFVGNPNPYYDGILLATLHDPISNNTEDGYPERFGSADANARLIAAAPELLAAAKRSLDWLASYPGGGARGACREMRAAIAKAEGQ